MKRIYRKGVWQVFFILILLALGVAGCEKRENDKEPSEAILEHSRKLAEKCLKKETDYAKKQKTMIEDLGKAGYPAVDTQNQRNMVQAKKVEEFCKRAEDKKEGKVTIFAVEEDGSFLRYDLETEDGNIHVTVSSLRWEKEKLKVEYLYKFQAETWKYTENGYLFLKRYHMPGYDGGTGVIGLRIKPLDEKCRELNQKYVLPLGYTLNNLLITDWGKGDYKELDFYDLYDVMYGMKYHFHLSYEEDYQGTEYEIPKENFEEVIKTYLPITSEEIIENTVYHSETETYRYRPRGLYDCGMPYEPYPEVVSYKRQEDGSLKLLVQGVWIREMEDKAAVSELVVKPLEDGGFEYISNTMLTPKTEQETAWYTKRLSDEEWETYYQEIGESY